jgi:hypothetical protein
MLYFYIYVSHSFPSSTRKDSHHRDFDDGECSEISIHRGHPFNTTTLIVWTSKDSTFFIIFSAMIFACIGYSKVGITASLPAKNLKVDFFGPPRLQPRRRGCSCDCSRRRSGASEPSPLYLKYPLPPWYWKCGHGSGFGKRHSIGHQDFMRRYHSAVLRLVINSPLTTRPDALPSIDPHRVRGRSNTPAQSK